MKNINKELVSLILIIASGSVILGVAGLIIYGLGWFIDLKYSGWFLIAYLLGCLTSYIFEKRQSTYITKAIKQAFLFPVKLFTGFITLSAPYLILQIHLLIYLFFACAVPAVFYLLDHFSDVINLNFPTHIYIFVTFSVVIATLLNDRIKQLIYLLSPFRISHLQKIKKIDFKELTDYLLSENNIKFIIYSIYFFYLLIINFFNFQQNSFYSDPETDKAVLQSFITFIALERLITNLKELEFKPSEMIRRLLDSMTGEDKKK
ncbi:MAG: hypothetical protein NXH73_06750 [Flavobacteriaceae bacterium]|nr:hypothetical protein [Flavobacteriaceae bacterium]